MVAICHGPKRSHFSGRRKPRFPLRSFTFPQNPVTRHLSTQTREPTAWAQRGSLIQTPPGCYSGLHFNEAVTTGCFVFNIVIPYVYNYKPKETSNKAKTPTMERADMQYADRICNHCVIYRINVNPKKVMFSVHRWMRVQSIQAQENVE